MPEIIVRVKNKIQFRTALAFSEVGAVIADFGCGPADIGTVKAENPETKFYLQLPDILREKKAGQVREIAEKALCFDGVVIKTFDELGLMRKVLAERGKASGTGQWTVIGDAFLYAYNTASLAFYRGFFPEVKFIAADELTDREIQELVQSAKKQKIAKEADFIYKVYGYQPLMITNQCLNRNYAGCMKPLMKFADEKKNQFFITSECGQCYSIIYNGQPTVMLDKVVYSAQGFLIDGQGYENILLDFTIESEEEMKRILKLLRKDSGHAAARIPDIITRGHHYRGVE